VVTEELTVRGTDPAELRAHADAVLEQHEAGDLEGALHSCERLLAVAETGDPDDPVVRESLFTARFERALLLTELGELEAAAEAYATAAATPSDLDDPDQRHELAMAELNRGICLTAVDDHEGALEVYDDVIATFQDAQDPVTRDQVVRARVNRAAALLALGDAVAARAGVEELIEGLDRYDALDAEQLAMAIRLRAATFQAEDRDADAAEALAAVAEVAAEDTAEDTAARVQIIEASRERAELLAALGRFEEAATVANEVVARFSGDPDPAVIQAVEELVDQEVALRDVFTPPPPELAAVDVEGDEEPPGDGETQAG
jgi:tetratricopeptide (TPR) repeat protein